MTLVHCWNILLETTQEVIMPTPTDYKRAAEMNLWAAKMMRRQGDDRSADNHLNMADFYIKQELRREKEGAGQ
ncbi:hypothetical protein [Brucella anthropi]|uniref:hypothetical protein n=1 Tax=Brucella anthropi TaxID=529 RepID=UPI002157FB26|nr:hypothetical protein [Brucella anthropi]MCR8493672.1 hypothetical protein [Brucella anthropi]